MVCEEKAIPYELNPATPHSPDVTAIHPFGKVPVMRHGDFELCESKAIATYLDLSFPGPKLIPTDPRHAALTEQWVSLVNTRIDGTLVRTYLFNYIFPKGSDGKPDRKAIDDVTPALKEEIGLLDRAVAKGGYLAGDSFTFRRYQRDADLILSAEFSGSRRCHIGGESPFTLLSAPRGPPEFPENNATTAAAVGRSVVIDCIPSLLQ
jgi:hypothetical protein